MRSDSTKCTEELYKLHAIKIGFIIFTVTTLPALPTNKNIYLVLFTNIRLLKTLPFFIRLEINSKN